MSRRAFLSGAGIWLCAPLAIIAQAQPSFRLSSDIGNRCAVWENDITMGNNLERQISLFC
jgi:hypothetical protein